jgi:hypothetical protein
MARKRGFLSRLLLADSSSGSPAKDRQEQERKWLDSARRALGVPLDEPTAKPDAPARSPEYWDDAAAFTDLKTQISNAAKQALERVQAAGGVIKARPDAILVTGTTETVTLRSNRAILEFASNL